MTTFVLWWLFLAPSPALAEAPSNDANAEAAPSAEAWLTAAVEAAGLQEPKALELRFRFRGTPYRLWLDGQRTIYQREVPSDDGAPTRTDRLEGDVFTSTVAGSPVPLPADQAGALRRSLNSVGYFALLPRPLLDEAVLATSLGTTTLGGQTWHTVEVRFREEGGGDDHDDVFRYWIHPETHRLGYLAYTFATGKGGVRVRRATRAHEVDGVVLLDWVNLGRNGQGLSIDDAVRDLDAGTLPELSTIELEGVQVRRDASPP
jgi:hypothetical protein